MMLKDLFQTPMNDEELLARQRALHGERSSKVVADLRRHADDKERIERLRTEAGFAMKNLFCLPGTGGKRFDVGTPPAWSECRVTDEEYLWSLNRMGWFYCLTELYLLTGERVYGERVVADLENWIDTCPMMPISDDISAATVTHEQRRFYGGLTPWRSLEVGIRLFDSWYAAYERLLMTDLMTPAFHAKLTVSLYEQARVLRLMSPIYWPKANHNHYIHEMLGLLKMACLYPDFKDSPAWRSFAIAELGRCVDNQFTEDGGQVEGCPGYHMGCLNMIYSFVEMGRTFGFEIPARILEACRRATEYTLYAMMPSGHWMAFGDTNMGKGSRSVVVPYYRCFGELGLVTRAMAIHRDFDPYVIPEQLQKEAAAEALTLPGGYTYQQELGQYYARTGWKTDDSAFGFLCCTPVNNGHAHQDPMTFVLALKGDPVVIDPSFFTYQAGDARKLFKSPEYHSCLTFDDKPPFEYVGMWSYSPQAEGRTRRHYEGDGFYAVDASHHNYDPDYHKRLCVLVGDDTFLVVDDVVNVTGTDVRLYFHMDDPTVELRGGEAVSERIRVLLPAGLAAEVLPSEKSPHNDHAEPSARIRLTDTAHANALYLTVFTKNAAVTSPAVERTAEGVRVSYKVGEVTKSFLWKFALSLTEEA